MTGDRPLYAAPAIAPNGSRAYVVYEADTAEQAEAILKNDPFCTGGVFVRWNLRPWKTVFVGKMEPVKPA